MGDFDSRTEAPLIVAALVGTRLALQQQRMCCWHKRQCSRVGAALCVWEPTFSYLARRRITEAAGVLVYSSVQTAGISALKHSVGNLRSAPTGSWTACSCQHRSALLGGH